ncbi:SpoIIE family protein phosphatase [Streptomyces sp. NPDC091377]|uniref:ATP-binding SpoIIE family protein phosphatase n=1 Tax=Streptomyces sp. NPDC091377 TaxID=3365995 RepID=UPI0038185CD9
MDGDAAPRADRPGGSPDARRDACLADALREIQARLRPSTSTAYLVTGADGPGARPDAGMLLPAMAVDTPLAFTLTPGMPAADQRYSTAAAYLTGTPVTWDDARIHTLVRSEPTMIQYAPYSMIVVSVPVRTQRRRFGALTLRWAPPRELAPEGMEFLMAAADRLALALERVAEDGTALEPPPAPVFIPSGEPGRDTRVTTGFLFRFQQLATGLAAARTTRDILAIARSEVLRPLGGRAMALCLADRGRLRVVGSAGFTRSELRGVDGLLLTGPGPETDATVGLRLLFFPDRRELRRTYPGLDRYEEYGDGRDDLPEAPDGADGVLDVPGGAGGSGGADGVGGAGGWGGVDGVGGAGGWGGVDGVGGAGGAGGVDGVGGAGGAGGVDGPGGAAGAGASAGTPASAGTYASGGAHAPGAPDAPDAADASDIPDASDLPGVPDAVGSAWLFLPLIADGQAMGCCVMAAPRSHALRDEDLAVLMIMLGQVAQSLQRARAYEREHVIARSMQHGLLPRTLPHLAEIVSTSRYLPADAGAEVGGDWYDMIRLPGGNRVGLVIGDVEGHSLDACGTMGQLRSVIRAYATEGHDPAGVLNRGNRLLADLDADHFATCLCLWLDLDTGTATVAGAGHPAPVVSDPSGTEVTFEVPVGPPLGVDAESRYLQAEFTLAPGSLVALYTDGLLDLNHVDMDAAFARLRRTLAAGRDEDLELLADRIVGDFGTSARRDDDLALLLVRYDGPGEGPYRHVAQVLVRRRDMQRVRRLRHYLRELLPTWGLAGLQDDLELLLTEVVTNALVHADSEVDIRLREYPGHLRVEVRDSDPRPPLLVADLGPGATGDADAESGRGMLIVDALASAWGSSPAGRGKTTWFEMGVKART